jgi:hypothetical protein
MILTDGSEISLTQTLGLCEGCILLSKTERLLPAEKSISYSDYNTWCRQELCANEFALENAQHPAATATNTQLSPS